MDQTELLDLLERVRSRFYGKYRGCVTSVDAQRGRIKAKVPAVLGEQETGWCMPCVPYAGDQVGFAFLPEVGSGVWIEFEGGDVSFPIWTGCYWRDGEMPSKVGEKVKVIQTVQPNALVLDDDQGSVELTDNNGNSVKLDSSGATVSNGSQKIVVSSSKVDVNDGALSVM